MIRHLRLSTLLIAVNVGVLLLAVGGVAFAATGLLRQLTDEQSLERVAQAGLIVQHEIHDTAGALLSDAQLLSERPTLLRLLESRQVAELSSFLAQFQRTSHLDATAVFLGDRFVAQSGAVLPWDVIWAMQHRSDRQFLYRLHGRGLFVLGAGADILALPEARVLVAVRLDDGFTQRLSEKVGLPVALVDRESAQSVANAPLATLRRHVLAQGQPASARIDDLGRYMAIHPLRDPSGEIVGLVETGLSTSGSAASLQRLVQALVLIALSVVALAGFFSLLLGRWLGWPFRSLTTAAARIGHGNLDTPVIQLPGVEIGMLAATLEEMRLRLLRLTGDLRRQQAEAHAILTGIIEGVFTVDRERQIRYINPQMAVMLGIQPEAALGRFCGDVLNPVGMRGVRPCAEQCPIIHARFRGGARATEQVQIANQQLRTVVITSAPPVDEQQVQVVRDETEIEATRRLRDAVLAHISHEFKTPLSAQLASIELLLERLPDLSLEHGQLVRSLQRGTLRLTQLIDNLLESVRIEAGQLSIRRKVVMIEDVIEEAVELIRPLIDQRNQQLVIGLEYPLPSLLGDTTRLIQVFVNLLANANKFSPRGSTITVGGEVQDSWLHIWVEDQGPGLPELANEALFSRFVRAVEQEPEQSGMGLGLWIVKSIVERHGGRVEAGRGETGTRMWIYLPVEREHENTDR